LPIALFLAVAPVLGYGIYFGLLVGPFGLCKKRKKEGEKFAATSSAMNVLRRTRRNL
jgi:hypothetical protein